MDADLGTWFPSRFDSEANVKLIHLHGSLQWFWTHDQKDTGGRRWLHRIGHADIDNVIDSAGRALEVENNRPCLSIGTHNKVTNYFKPPFSELYAQVTRLLREDGDVERIVMVGYGGADKGVNHQVVDWMQASTARSVVLVHPRPDSWASRARPHIGSSWPDWQKAGRGIVIPKWFKDVTTDEWVGSCKA
jgi:hypothetical protein